MKDVSSDAGPRRLVRVHAWLIALTATLVVGGTALVLLSQPQEHVAESEVEVLSRPTEGAPILPTMGTERRFALSGSVAADAADRMDVEVAEARRGLSVSAVVDSEVLVLRYTAPARRQALEGAEAFTQSYVASRNARYRTRTVEVITEPTLLPADGPGRALLLLGASLVAGLGLGILLAFLWDRVRDRVRSSGELTGTGFPVLAEGRVLADGSWSGTGSSGGGSGYLASRIASLTQHRRRGVRVLVTSPSDGTSAAQVASAAAAALATAGRRIVLVDAVGDHADVPGDALGADLPVGAPGLADMVSGACSLEAGMRPAALEGVRVVSRGTSQDLERADVDGMANVLGRMAADNIVVLAGPPLLAHGSSWRLAEHADVIVMVAHLDRLRRRDAFRASEMLTGAGHSDVVWVTTRGGRRLRRSKVFGRGRARRRSLIRTHVPAHRLEVEGPSAS